MTSGLDPALAGSTHRSTQPLGLKAEREAETEAESLFESGAEPATSRGHLAFFGPRHSGGIHLSDVRLDRDSREFLLERGIYNKAAGHLSRMSQHGAA